MHDEFDELAAKRPRAGAHVRARTTFGKVMPFILAIILGPLLAIGAVTLASHRGDGNPFEDLMTTATEAPSTEPAEPTEPTESKSVTLSTDEPTDEPTSDPTEDPTDEPTDEPTTEAPALPEGVRGDASILILNGSATPGAETEAKDKLASEGFTSIETGAYQNARPEVTTLYFRTANEYTTAQHVARSLVIDNWLELASATANYDVVIVLR